MDSIDDVLEALKRLGREHGKILPLNLIFSTLMRDKLYNSKEVIVNCLRTLHKKNKIKPINFGIDIELLEDIEMDDEFNTESRADSDVDYVQASLDGFGLKKRV